jgi:hypothetical protein
VCSVETQTCQASQCDPNADAPGGCTGTRPYCFEQHRLSGIGACYELCDPYDVACAGGLECVSVSDGQELGVCQNPGSGTVGAACDPSAHPDDAWMTNSGCAAGLACVDDVCLATCDYFGTPNCSGAAVCFPGGTCGTPEGGAYDAVAVGGDCLGASGGERCGYTGGRDGYEGECQNIGDGQGMVCHAHCDAAGKYTCAGAMDVCYDVLPAPRTGSVGLCGAPAASGCVNASDCQANEICDVETQTCQSSECDPAAAQPGGCAGGTDPVCRAQNPGATVGACYEQCDPYDAACPAGPDSECVSDTPSQSSGVCLTPGTGTTGQPCSPLPGIAGSTSSGCAAGNVCLGNVCRQTCDYFGAPTCDAATVCQLSGYCDLPGGGTWDTVAIGSDCTGASGGEDCGLIGGHDGFQGACNDLSDGLGMICRPYCSFVDNTCDVSPFDGACHDVFPEPLKGDVGTCRQ